MPLNPSNGVHREQLKQPRASSVPPEELFQEVDSLHSIAARRLVRLVRPHTSLGSVSKDNAGEYEPSAPLGEHQQWQELNLVSRYGAARAATVEQKVTRLGQRNWCLLVPVHAPVMAFTTSARLICAYMCTDYHIRPGSTEKRAAAKAGRGTC